MVELAYFTSKILFFHLKLILINNKKQVLKNHLFTEPDIILVLKSVQC